jgi:hypothetical protein
MKKLGLLSLGCFFLIGCASVPNTVSSNDHAFRSLASGENTPALIATLSTGGVPELKTSFIIKASTSDPTSWIVERWDECLSYPCNPKDFMKSTTVHPVTIRDEREGDGDLEIKLSNEMSLIYKNPGPIPMSSKSKTDYFLIYSVNGQKKQIPIYLRAQINT